MYAVEFQASIENGVVHRAKRGLSPFLSMEKMENNSKQIKEQKGDCPLFFPFIKKKKKLIF